MNIFIVTAEGVALSKSVAHLSSCAMLGRPHSVSVRLEIDRNTCLTGGGRKEAQEKRRPVSTREL